MKVPESSAGSAGWRVWAEVFAGGGGAEAPLRRHRQVLRLGQRRPAAAAHVQPLAGARRDGEPPLRHLRRHARLVRAPPRGHCEDAVTLVVCI